MLRANVQWDSSTERGLLSKFHEQPILKYYLKFGLIRKIAGICSAFSVNNTKQWVPSEIMNLCLLFTSDLINSDIVLCFFFTFN